MTNKAGKLRKRKITWFGIGLLVLMPGFIYFAVTTRKVIIQGGSMEPTYTAGLEVLTSSAYWLIGPINDEDIVVIKGTKPKEYWIKRVHRKAGEEVRWDMAPLSYDISKGPYKVPDDSLYVLGDNLDASEDSRTFGPIPISRVLGKVVSTR